MDNKKTIDHLTIKGFNSIMELDRFPLSRLNVLIGANGAGKSNFVSYFRMMTELINGRLQLWTRKNGSADRLVSFGIKRTTKVRTVIEFGQHKYTVVLDTTSDGGFVFSEESRTYDGNWIGKEWTPFGMGHLESNFTSMREKTLFGSAEDICFDSMSRWRVYHFHDTSDTAGVKREGAVHENEYLRPDGENLPAFLYRLKSENSKVYEQIRKTVRLGIPFFDDFLLKPTQLKSGEEQIRLLWRQRESDYSLWPSQLSDGSIRFICLVTALLQPDPPSTIIIDEPELGLHPFAVTLLASLLRSASERMQVIVSTQSVSLVNEFQVEDLVVVERENGASSFRRFEKDDFRAWLEEYSLGDLWAKNILGGRPPK